MRALIRGPASRGFAARCTAPHALIAYMTTVVILRSQHAQDPAPGRQGESVGGGGPGDPGQAFGHHPARQAVGGRAWLCRLGAVVPRALVRPAADVGAARARGLAWGAAVRRCATPACDALPGRHQRHFGDRARHGGGASRARAVAGRHARTPPPRPGLAYIECTTAKRGTEADEGAAVHRPRDAGRPLPAPPHPPALAVWIGAQRQQPARQRRGPSGRVRARRQTEPASQWPRSSWSCRPC